MSILSVVRFMVPPSVKWWVHMITVQSLSDESIPFG